MPQHLRELALVRFHHPVIGKGLKDSGARFVPVRALCLNGAIALALCPFRKDSRIHIAIHAASRWVLRTLRNNLSIIPTQRTREYFRSNTARPFTPICSSRF